MGKLLKQEFKAPYIPKLRSDDDITIYPPYSDSDTHSSDIPPSQNKIEEDSFLNWFQ